MNNMYLAALSDFEDWSQRPQLPFDRDGWFQAVEKVTPLKPSLGLLDGYFDRVKYLEEVMLRSIFHEVTGELPTDEALAARITVVHYPDKSYAYLLDNGKPDSTCWGDLLLRRESGFYEPINPDNLLRTVFRSPLFA